MGRRPFRSPFPKARNRGAPSWWKECPEPWPPADAVLDAGAKPRSFRRMGLFDLAELRLSPIAFPRRLQLGQNRH